MESWFFRTIGERERHPRLPLKSRRLWPASDIWPSRFLETL